MNAGGVSKACKSNEYFYTSGKRESNALVTYLKVRDNPEKFGLIPDSLFGVKLRRLERGLRPISLLVR